MYRTQMIQLAAAARRTPLLRWQEKFVYCQHNRDTIHPTRPGSSPRFSSGSTTASSFALPDETLVDVRCAPPDYVTGSATVYRDFVSPTEEQQLVDELQQKLKRARYQRGHWDAVIIDYRETEMVDEGGFLSDASRHVLNRTRAQLAGCHFGKDDKEVEWLPAHCIDLKKEGELNAHVDSVRYSGDIVAGLSFLSPAIMRLQEEEENDDDSPRAAEHVDLLLPPRSLYVLTGPCRYRYTHELLPSGATFGKLAPVERDHRLSIIFRDAKQQEQE